MCVCVCVCDQVASNGLVTSAQGITSTAGSMTIVAGGLTVTSGGMTLNSGSLSVVGTVSITSAGTAAPALHVNSNTGDALTGRLAAGAINANLLSLTDGTSPVLQVASLTCHEFHVM